MEQKWPEGIWMEGGWMEGNGLEKGRGLDGGQLGGGTMGGWSGNATRFAQFDVACRFSVLRFLRFTGTVPGGSVPVCGLPERSSAPPGLEDYSLFLKLPDVHRDSPLQTLPETVSRGFRNGRGLQKRAQGNIPQLFVREEEFLHGTSRSSSFSPTGPQNKVEDLVVHADIQLPKGLIDHATARAKGGS
ncbi:hypothetical protein AK812_SmicGene38393 [Symbiodinium microadriaticum]|uniref:Uncharacterized protein n=1 Tax=Symbiodinium microadriaticum TaxID=2951 RepID=A0A1Q9CDY3_SYMMI|nr:hypothetical protein AK812_SmicGene38393 [Symbiodinium microadriaticum]